MNYNEELIKLRHELHKIPEIAYQEFKTCEYICKKLTEYNVAHEVVFNTGVVAVIGNQKNECIALRADIDALPIVENNKVSYKSTVDGMMHACGHDGHTAILLMTAKILKERESELEKCIKLIFQPAEEGSGGAEPMIKEGVLENPSVCEVYACHLWPDVEVGRAEYVSGTAFAGSYRYTVTVKGKGGHGAIPAGVINSLIPASEIIIEIERLNLAEKDSVISACALNSGGTFNIYPDNTEILGTIRTLTVNDTERILKNITALIENISEKYDINIEFDPVFEYPPCINDEETLKKLKNAAERAIENVTAGKKTYGAEDFAYFSIHSKAAHIRIGSRNSDDKSTCYPLHNSNFDIDESSLLCGVKVFLEICGINP